MDNPLASYWSVFLWFWIDAGLGICVHKKNSMNNIVLEIACLATTRLSALGVRESG
jgi:hypothetical protein